MRPLILAILLSLVSVTSGAAPEAEQSAEQTYDLRGKSVVGEKTRTVLALRMSKGKANVDVAGQHITGTVSISTSMTETVETIGVEKGVTTRLLISHDTDRTLTKFNLMGAPGDTEEERGALEGRTELAEFRDGRWMRTLVGPPPTEEQQKELQRGLSDPTEEYPEAVKIGDTWELTGDALRRWFGETEAESSSGKMTFRLESVTRQKLGLVANIAFEGTLNTVSKDDEGEPTAMSITLKGRVERSLDHHIDLAVIGEGSMSADSQHEEEGQTIKVRFSGPITFRSHDTKL